MANAPLINILIRTTENREREFSQCVNSIARQTYKNIYVVVCTDSVSRTLDNSISKYLGTLNCEYEIFNVESTRHPYHWNFYCNNLKERVTDGWFFYLDDDDYLVDPRCLEKIAERLDNPTVGVICQFNRGKRAKPSVSHGDIYVDDWTYIIPSSLARGRIGGSCIFLHHSQKDIASWDGKRAADYRFIKAVSEKIPLKFVPVVVVQAGNNGRHGK